MSDKRTVKVSAKVTITDRFGKPIDNARVEGLLGSPGVKSVPVVLTPGGGNLGGVYELQNHSFEVAATAMSFTLEITRVGDHGDSLAGKLQATGTLQASPRPELKVKRKELKGNQIKVWLVDSQGCEAAKLRVDLLLSAASRSNHCLEELQTNKEGRVRAFLPPSYRNAKGVRVVKVSLSEP